MAHTKNHDYHILEPSFWPLLGSIGAFTLALGAIQYFDTKSLGQSYLIYVGFAIVIATMFLWWRDVVREAEHNGDHTPVVQIHNRYGMLLFILSEVMFFVAWFWAYFDPALFPNDIWKIMTAGGAEETMGMVERAKAMGGVFPPEGTKTFNPWDLPLINTIILLLSGTTVTWAHHALLNNNRKHVIWGLALTVLLGALFTYCQYVEYAHAGFKFTSLYGSAFFMATGFHGAHVLIGTIFLFVILLRVLKGHFTPKQHFGFEAAAWYWHFVDVVWLFLFACIYVWGQ